METKLTPKQVKFVDEYLIDHNASAAARRAGYSTKTANEQGSQLLRNTKIAHEILLRQIEDSKRLSLTKERLLNELAVIAFADPVELILRLNSGRSIKGISTRFIRGISISKSGWSLTLPDKLTAIQMLMKYLGFDGAQNSESNEGGSTENPLERILRIVRERAEQANQERKDSE